MMELKIYRRIELKGPAMIAAWPGMGNVALGTVDYIRRNTRALRFAEIKLDPVSMLDAVEVHKGLSKLPRPPRSTFYYSEDYNIIIFEGEVQVAGKDGIELLNRVLDVAVEFRVSKIYTAAALALPISFRDASQVYTVANKEILRDGLVKSGLKLMEGGHISGLNGLMLGFAAKRNIDAACLLAAMPQYAINLPNPKASKAVIEVLNKLLGVKVDTQELDDYVRDMDERMSVIEDKVKDVFTVEAEASGFYPQEKKIPGYITDKIERLFLESKIDRKKAPELKRELDRWDLYKMYEDRFLDLFKEKQ